MNKQKMEIIYEIILVGLPLTEEVLLLYYFTLEEIEELVNNGILKTIKPHKYILNDTDGLYCYGVKLLSLNHPKVANECFRKCYQINPNDRKSCIQLIIIELKKGNYYGAYGLFDILEKIEPEQHQKENNLYLYLLNKIARCDKDKKERVFSIELEDVLELNCDNDLEDIIKYIMNGKYKISLKLLNDLIANKSFYITEYMILKELLIQIINKEELFKTKLFNVVKNKKYYSIINYLETKAKDRSAIDITTEDEIIQKLTPYEKRIYLITKAIINIQINKVIPTINKREPATLDEAIRTNNFNIARRKNISYLKYRKNVFEEDIIYLLLEDINTLIKEIKNEQEKEIVNQLLHSENNKREMNIVENTNSHNEETILCDVSSVVIDTNNDIEQDTCLDKISEEEEIAYSIKQSNMSLNSAIKILGLFKEQVLLVKLVYVRDYYIEGTEEAYIMGDKLLQEVDNTLFKTEEIEKIISELKENRDNYKNIEKGNCVFNPFIRKRK